MSVNKVIYNAKILIDLTSDSVSADTLLKGITAHDKSGNVITGTFEGGTYEDGDNLTYGPNYYTVTFETNGGDNLDSLLVEEGLTIELPESNKSGYEFEGWYTDANLINEFDSLTPITEDITLYAKWGESSGYSISFICDYMESPNMALYSLDNGVTWNDFYDLYNGGDYVNPILKGVSQIKFKCLADWSFASAIYSPSLNVNLRADAMEMVDEVESNNIILDSNVDDLTVDVDYY